MLNISDLFDLPPKAKVRQAISSREGIRVAKETRQPPEILAYGIELERSLTSVQTVVFDSPAELLASLFVPLVDTCRLLLVSGPRQAGKTHWCMQLVEQAHNLGLDVAGLISPAVFDGSQKVRIDLLDLATGTRRSLAVRKVEKDDNLVAGAWEFDPEALEWGNAQLGAIRHSQLLVVDELGPLEFQNHTGWMNAFPLIESRCYRLACLVVRPELLSRALERWPWAEVMELPARVGAG